jgi:NAD(P)-dependent dehydrogenase (short-subunit alcohol dehydrogenase family)
MHGLSRRSLLVSTALLAMPAMIGMAQEPSAAPSTAGKQRTVLITGANRGIGLEFVRQYAGRGWRVIATTRDPTTAKDLEALAAANTNVVIEKLDVTDHPGIDALAKRYEGQPIDILINNAGLMQGPDKGQMVGSIDYAEFERFYRINAMGPLKVSEAFFPNVKASDMKVMSALTTGRGKRGIPVPGFTLYKTSKAALDAIQHEIAIRWKQQGIKVVTLLPGRVLTHSERATPGQATVSAEDSVAGMMKVLDTLTMEQSDRTIQWNGTVVD